MKNQRPANAVENPTRENASTVETTRPTGKFGAGVHPHLYFSRDDLDAIRAKIRHPRFSRDWAALEKEAQAILSLPIFLESDGFKIQKLAASRAADLALAYRISNDEHFRKRAAEILDAFVEARSWLNEPPHAPFALNQGGICRGLALTYDLLADTMTQDERNRFVSACLEKAVKPFLADCRSPVNKYLNGHRTQNHLVAYASGAGCLLLAIDGEGVDLSREIEIARAHTLRFIEWYDTGGSATEFGGYWASANHHTLQFLWALERKGYPGVFYQRARKLERFCYPHLYLSVGQRFAANFADNHYNRSQKDTRGIALLLARKYRDPILQWWAGQMPPGDAMALIWGDPEMPEEAPRDFPSACVFGGCGVGVLRTDVTDPNALFLGLRGGKTRGPAYDGSHCQFDLNSVVLEAYGKRLLADYGYDHAFMETKHHNTLLIDGHGQKFEESPIAHLQDLSPEDDIDYIVSRLEQGYGAVLSKFDRHAYMIERKFWILVDEVELTAPATLTWNFHAVPEANIRVRDSEAEIQNGDVCLLIHPFGDVPLNLEARTDLPFPRLQCDTTQPTARALAGWVLTIQGDKPALRIQAKQDGDGISISYDGKTRHLPLVKRRCSFRSDIMLSPTARNPKLPPGVSDFY